MGVLRACKSSSMQSILQLCQATAFCPLLTFQLPCFKCRTSTSQATPLTGSRHLPFLGPWVGQHALMPCQNGWVTHSQWVTGLFNLTLVSLHCLLRMCMWKACPWRSVYIHAACVRVVTGPPLSYCVHKIKGVCASLLLMGLQFFLCGLNARKSQVHNHAAHSNVSLVTASYQKPGGREKRAPLGTNYYVHFICICIAFVLWMLLKLLATR